MKKILTVLFILVCSLSYGQFNSWFFVQDQQPELKYIDFVVVRYIWGSGDGSDLDTGTEFDNSTILNVDHIPVGYGMNHQVPPLLYWGADNLTSGDESFYINIQQLRNTYYVDIPDITDINMYADWYNTKLTGNIQIEIKSYRGGSMSLVGYTWTNTGGVLISVSLINSNVSANCQCFASFRTSFTYLGKVRYNKTTDLVSFSL